MSLSAEGAHAVVTGASRGIGLAVARALRARGAQVMMVARTRATLEQAASEIGGIAFAADLASTDGAHNLVAHAATHFGAAPDIIVNAAGAFNLASVATTSIEDFDAMMATNLRAPFVVVRAFLPSLLARGSGHIVSIGSVAGRSAYPGNGAYSASKFGLRGLHEVLEQELKGTGVRATLVEPAATDTGLWDSIDFENNPDLPSRSAMLTAEEVAECVMFALERPSAITVKYIGIERS